MYNNIKSRNLDIMCSTVEKLITTFEKRCVGFSKLAKSRLFWGCSMYNSRDENIKN